MIIGVALSSCTVTQSAILLVVRRCSYNSFLIEPNRFRWYRAPWYSNDAASNGQSYEVCTHHHPPSALSFQEFPDPGNRHDRLRVLNSGQRRVWIHRPIADREAPIPKPSRPTNAGLNESLVLDVPDTLLSLRYSQSVQRQLQGRMRATFHTSHSQIRTRT